MTKPKGTEMNYTCGWCGHKFTRVVVYVNDSKKNSYSSTVVCPKCMNKIPTWERKETGEVVGQKHFHPGRV